jgi:molybdate transport system ATP-binding protein
VSAGVEARVAVELGDFRLDASVSAPAAGVTGVVGASGSGKTTLLRCLAGLERRAEGRIEVAGEIWLDTERGRCEPPHRRCVGLVFQDSALFPHLSVRGNLEYGLRRTPAGRRRVSLDEVVASLGLAPLLARHPAGLSGGERQRVAIGRALLAGPRLLLLDEPVASLDAAARSEILERLQRLLARAPIPVFYVTHSRSEVLRLSDRVVVLDAGRVRAAGGLREVMLGPHATAFGAPDELGVVVDGEVAEVDPAHGLSSLRFAGGMLAVPGVLAVGQRRRVEILARDVSLALDPPGRTSILNVLSGRVVEVRDGGPLQPVVVVEVGGTPILARVTRRSLAQLGIAPGLAVHVQLKAVALVA